MYLFGLLRHMKIMLPGSCTVNDPSKTFSIKFLLMPQIEDPTKIIKPSLCSLFSIFMYYRMENMEV